MMNVPGILNGNPEACSKIAAALNLDKPVDGHAPLCTGADLEAYARAGIRTDHECTTSSRKLFKTPSLRDGVGRFV